MLLKTYRAPDLATALSRARKEMGPDALVLGTNENAGRFGLSAVEVTVGVARETPRETGDQKTSSRHLAGELKDIQRRVARDVAKRRPTPGAGRTAAASAVSKRNGNPGSKSADVSPANPRRSDEEIWQTHPALRASVEALVGSGLSLDLARRLARRVLDPTGDTRTIAEAATSGLRELVPFASPPLGNRCTFVIGPPGCGKTTTVAKLVARTVASTDGPVFFAQTDRDRIGAFEQAEIFARFIGARVARVNDLEDWRYVLRDAGDRGSILVDTPGIGARDHDRLAELLELRKQAPHSKVALLVPAGLHRREASRIIDRFAAFEPDCVGFSRTDDGAMPGELVTALANRKLPLAFFTDGPSIPKDLTPASPQGLAALLLRSGAERVRKRSHQDDA